MRHREMPISSTDAHLPLAVRLPIGLAGIVFGSGIQSALGLAPTLANPAMPLAVGAAAACLAGSKKPSALGWFVAITFVALPALFIAPLSRDTHPSWPIEVSGAEARLSLAVGLSEAPLVRSETHMSAREECWVAHTLLPVSTCAGILAAALWHCGFRCKAWIVTFAFWLLMMAMLLHFSAPSRIRFIFPRNAVIGYGMQVGMLMFLACAIAAVALASEWLFLSGRVSDARMEPAASNSRDSADQG